MLENKKATVTVLKQSPSCAISLHEALNEPSPHYCTSLALYFHGINFKYFHSVSFFEGENGNFMPSAKASE